MTFPELQQLLADLPAIQEVVADLLEQKKTAVDSAAVLFQTYLQNFLHTEIQRLGSIAKRIQGRRGYAERLDESLRMTVQVNG